MNKMNFKKTKKTIIDEIAGSVKSAGFKYDKNDEFFIKDIPGGIDTFYFLTANYGIEFRFDLFWGVRIDRIADIYNMVTDKTEEYFRFSHVLANHLGALIEHIDNANDSIRCDPKRYTILKEEDVAEVIDKALTDIRKYIMPYFEQNVTVERMDQILNRKPKEYTVHNSTYLNRAMMGLIAAKLVNNPRYDELVSIYDVELAGAAIDAKREYQKLKEWLSKMPITA